MLQIVDALQIQKHLQILLQVEVVESLVEDQDTMEHPSEHDDRQSEHSEHEPENQPAENEEGVHVVNFVSQFIC